MAVILILTGVICLMYAVVNAFSVGSSLQGIFYMYDKWNYGALGFALLVPGIGLALGNARIVRWIVPVPRDECPRCGYSLRALTGDQCPECGFALALPTSSPKP